MKLIFVCRFQIRGTNITVLRLIRDTDDAANVCWLKHL